MKIEQFLINMGKLGAADLVGKINNDKDLTNFKFESNVFVDNKKCGLSFPPRKYRTFQFSVCLTLFPQKH